MNKTNAIKHARANVGELYPFGNNYRFNYWDESVSAWRESHPKPYYSARLDRSTELIYMAARALGESKEDAFFKVSHYFEGKSVDVGEYFYYKLA